MQRSTDSFSFPATILQLFSSVLHLLLHSFFVLGGFGFGFSFGVQPTISSWHGDAAIAGSGAKIDLTKGNVTPIATPPTRVAVLTTWRREIVVTSTGLRK